jgi:hypothetical protein
MNQLFVRKSFKIQIIVFYPLKEHVSISTANWKLNRDAMMLPSLILWRDEREHDIGARAFIHSIIYSKKCIA